MLVGEPTVAARRLLLRVRRRRWLPLEDALGRLLLLLLLWWEATIRVLLLRWRRQRKSACLWRSFRLRLSTRGWVAA